MLLAACQSPSKAATQTVRGVLIAVDSHALQSFESIELRTDDGQELTFRPAPDYVPGGGAQPMTPGHMRQHMALADPVLVTYRQEGDQLLAVTITDAT
jgi:hypothetical protein